jgi:hypothetical protein
MTADLEAKKALLRSLKADFPLYAAKCLKVLTKEGKIAPLQLNAAQLYVHKRIEQQLATKGKVRVLVLKGRQQGISTYVQARFMHKLSFRKGLTSYILTHLADSTDTLFQMTKRYHENLPGFVQPVAGRSNDKELYFKKLECRYSVATAGSAQVGRGKAIQMFHGSEVGFWPNPDTIWPGLGQAIADMDDTEIILESTANGVGGDFHTRWRLAEAGLSDYEAIFVPWFWQTEYERKDVPPGIEWEEDEEELRHLFGLSDGQLYFRRRKIMDDFKGDVTRFQQEYPCTSTEAFVNAKRDSLISVPSIVAARVAGKQRLVTPLSSVPLVVGVDPARYGDDRTGIVWRRGRCVTRVRTLAKKNTMQVAGIVAKIIKDDKPAKVFIDIVGLGVGVYDRLVELGYGDIVVGVQASESADEDDLYINKRAEMWTRMRDWFNEKPVAIPDSDAMQADLVEPGFDYDSKSRIRIESKEKIKKRGGLSPDIADALSLTFAENLGQLDHNQPHVPIHRPHDPGVGY